MDFYYWKSQRFGKSPNNFFLRFLKSMGWYGVFCVFSVLLNLFHQCFVKKLLKIFKFDTLFYQRLPLEAYLYPYDGVLCAKETHRLDAMDLKIYT
jgi:hypothetical protein